MWDCCSLKISSLPHSCTLSSTFLSCFFAHHRPCFIEWKSLTSCCLLSSSSAHLFHYLFDMSAATAMAGLHTIFFFDILRNNPVIWTVSPPPSVTVSEDLAKFQEIVLEASVVSRPNIIIIITVWDGIRAESFNSNITGAVKGIFDHLKQTPTFLCRPNIHRQREGHWWSCCATFHHVQTLPHWYPTLGLGLENICTTDLELVFHKCAQGALLLKITAQAQENSGCSKPSGSGSGIGTLHSLQDIYPTILMIVFGPISMASPLHLGLDLFASCGHSRARVFPSLSPNTFAVHDGAFDAVFNIHSGVHVYRLDVDPEESNQMHLGPSLGWMYKSLHADDRNEAVEDFSLGKTDRLAVLAQSSMSSPRYGEFLFSWQRFQDRKVLSRWLTSSNSLSLYSLSLSLSLYLSLFLCCISLDGKQVEWLKQHLKIDTIRKRK